MPANFFDRLRNYYLDVAKVLRGEASVASIFPNTSDKGFSRERVYLEFLKQHVPSKCNVFQGGFLFDEDGSESKQLDIIVTTDTAPQFNFHNTDGSGKSFSPVEGSLAVVSIKSNLDKKELFDALEGVASIPATKPLTGRLNPLVKIANYDDWPLKVIYAPQGIAPETLLKHLSDFYAANPMIPVTRRPDFIHVSGGCLIARPTVNICLRERSTGDVVPLPAGHYFIVPENPETADLHGVVSVLNHIQQYAIATTHITFDYVSMVNRVTGAL